MLPRLAKSTPVTNITISMTFIIISDRRPLEQVYLFPMTPTSSRRALPVLLLGLGLLLIVFALYYIGREVPAQSDLSAVPAKVNYAAPELTLTDLQGTTHSLTDYRGQVVLVNLWATWCPPCKEEMPTLQSFYTEHKAQGFMVVAINEGSCSMAGSYDFYWPAGFRRRRPNGCRFILWGNEQRRAPDGNDRPRTG